MSVKSLQRLKKRHKRLLLKMHGTGEKPRLFMRRSLNNLFAQVIDDDTGKVLFSLSTLDKEVKAKHPSCGNIKVAQFFGEVFARRAKEKGIVKIVFDRGGYMYHGRVKAFADSLRKGGLSF